jgi:hypothetical protein
MRPASGAFCGGRQVTRHDSALRIVAASPADSPRDMHEVEFEKLSDVATHDEHIPTSVVHVPSIGWG